MFRPSPQFVLFDLDGVLVSTQQIWFHLLEEAGRVFRGRAITREEFDPTFGQGTEADQKIFNLACTPAELNAYYIDHFDEYAGGLWINPSSRPVLSELLRNGKRLAVVTNTAQALATRVLARADLLDCFSSVACADQVASPKPAPDVIFHALSELGGQPEQAWMIGDSRYDREAAQAAGVFFVGLGTAGAIRIDDLSDLVFHVLKEPPDV